MQAFVVLLLFVGMLMVVHGIYEERFQMLNENVRVEYRFVPRTYYEEQLSPAEGTLSSKFQNIFEDETPWQYRSDAKATTRASQNPGSPP